MAVPEFSVISVQCSLSLQSMRWQFFIEIHKNLFKAEHARKYKKNARKNTLHMFLFPLLHRPPSLHRRELRLRPDQNHLVHSAAHVRLWAGGRILPHDQLHHNDSHAPQPRHQIQEEETVIDGMKTLEGAVRQPEFLTWSFPGLELRKF